MFLNLSVRAYHLGRKYGLPEFSVWEAMPAAQLKALCVKAAESILANRRGKKVAAELFRAGGLGVYTIADIMTGEEFTIEKIREVCERYDSER